MKKKVYVVVCHYNNERYVEVVFEDKVKAEQYCECHKGCYFIESYIGGDKNYTTFNSIEIKYDLHQDGSVRFFNFRTLAKEDYQEYLENRNESIKSITVKVFCSGMVSIRVQKELPKVYDKQEVEDKYGEFLLNSKEKILGINSKYDLTSLNDRTMCEKEIEEYFRNNLDLKSEFFN